MQIHRMTSQWQWLSSQTCMIHGALCKQPGKCSVCRIARRVDAQHCYPIWYRAHGCNVCLSHHTQLVPVTLPDWSPSLMEIGGNENRTRLFVRSSNQRTVISIIRCDGARSPNSIRPNRNKRAIYFGGYELGARRHPMERREARSRKCQTTQSIARQHSFSSKPAYPYNLYVTSVGFPHMGPLRLLINSTKIWNSAERKSNEDKTRRTGYWKVERTFQELRLRSLLMFSYSPLPRFVEKGRTYTEALWLFLIIVSAPQLRP